MIRKPNNSLPYFLVIIIFLITFFMGGCSSEGEENSEQEGLEEQAMLPSLEQVLPDDQYLFLPLENVGFRLTFMGPVDPAVVEQAVSFEPELDFAVRNEGYGPGEIYLDPQEKLQSDTSYILRIKDVQNESTGKHETLQFAYRTEFRGDWRVAEPQWSHDGEEIAYLVQPAGSDTAELWKVDIGDGSEQLADGAAWPGRIDWSPDDSVILYTKMIYQPDKNYSIPEVRTVDRDGREEKIVVSDEELAEIASFGPINTYSWWSPNGKKIAMQLDLGGEDAHSDLHRSMALVNSDGTDLTTVEGQIFVGWQDADRLMVLKTHQNYNYGRSYRYDLFSVGTDGKEEPALLLGEGQIPNFDRADQSHDNRKLAIGRWESLNTVNGFKDEGTGLLLYDVQQISLSSFGLNSGYQKHPAVSPNGEDVAFTANKDGNWNLYLRENDTIKQLTSDPAHELCPVWSPKGEKIAFVSTRGGAEEIWLLELSSGKEKQLTGLGR